MLKVPLLKGFVYTLDFKFWKKCGPRLTFYIFYREHFPFNMLISYSILMNAGVISSGWCNWLTAPQQDWVDVPMPRGPVEMFPLKT